MASKYVKNLQDTAERLTTTGWDLSALVCTEAAVRMERMEDMITVLANPNGKKEAHVICCNDATEFVIIGTKECAEEKMEELARKYFDQNGGAANWRGGLYRTYDSTSDDEVVYREHYRSQCRWHIRTVGLEVSDDPLRP